MRRRGSHPSGSRLAGAQSCRWPPWPRPHQRSAEALAGPAAQLRTIRAARSRPKRTPQTYNNYYEFSEDKDLWRGGSGAASSGPGRCNLDGMVKQPRTIEIDDLLKQVTLEERVYRHRCVEAWAMTVPWTGFPLAKLLRIAEPLGSAKFIVFETDADKKVDARTCAIRFIRCPISRR